MLLRFFLAWTLALSTGCVLKGTHNETVAQNVAVSSQLSELQREHKALRAKASEQRSRLAQMEMRNEELSKTNQRLVGKNTDYVQNSLKSQDQLLELKREKLAAEKESHLSKKIYDDLLRALRDEIAKDQIHIAHKGERLTINLSNQILFASGKANVQSKGRKVLKKLAAVVKKTKNRQIEVAGHSDNVPIRGSLKKKFPTNWELSTSRATNVVRFLEKSGIRSKRLSAVGFGEHHPIASNKTAEGRRTNRRIEVILLPAPKS